MNCISCAALNQPGRTIPPECFFNIQSFCSSTSDSLACGACAEAPAGANSIDNCLRELRTEFLSTCHGVTGGEQNGGGGSGSHNGGVLPWDTSGPGGNPHNGVSANNGGVLPWKDHGSSNSNGGGSGDSRSSSKSESTSVWDDIRSISGDYQILILLLLSLLLCCCCLVAYLFISRDKDRQDKEAVLLDERTHNSHDPNWQHQQGRRIRFQVPM